MARSHFRDTAVGLDGGALVALPGATINVFNPGTTTPTTIPMYNVPTGGVPLVQPLVADVTGTIEFWTDTDERVDLQVNHPNHAPRTVTVDVMSQTFTGDEWNGGIISLANLVNPTIAGTLFFSPPASKIIPGTTSISIRNHADAVDNFLVLDTGIVQFRNTVTITSGDLVLNSGTVISSGSSAVAGNLIAQSGNVGVQVDIGNVGPGGVSGIQFGSPARQIYASSISMLTTPSGFTAVGTVAAANLVTQGLLQFTATVSSGTAAGTIYRDSSLGLVIQGALGSSGDVALLTRTGTTVFANTAAGSPDAVLGGSLTFSGVSVRIVADFTSTIHANRALFKTSISGGSTNIGIVPDTTGTLGRVTLYGASTPDQAPVLQLSQNAASGVIDVNRTGSATQGTLTLRVGGTNVETLFPSLGVSFFDATDPGASVLRVAGNLVVTGTVSASNLFVNPMTTNQDLIVGGASGVPARLGVGTSTQVLTVVGSTIAWATPTSGGMTNPMTTAGDIIYGGSGGIPTRLGIGSNTQVLTLVAGLPVWQAPVSGGMTNPMTTADDIIKGGASGAPERLAKGANNTVLTVTAGVVGWAATAAVWVPTATSDLDMGNFLITNIGNAATDFVTGGGLNLAGGLGFSAVSSAIAGLYRSAANGLVIQPNSGSTNDFTITNSATTIIFRNPTGTTNIIMPGTLNVAGSVTAGSYVGLPTTLVTNPMTTAGDIIVGGASGTPARLGIGATNTVLTVVGATPTWSASVTVTGVSNSGRETFTGNSTALAGSIYKTAADGLVLQGITGSTNDVAILNNAGSIAWRVPAGTQKLAINGDFSSFSGGNTFNLIVGSLFQSTTNISFQTATPNAGTGIYYFPNGTGTSCEFDLFNTSGNWAGNGGYGRLLIDATGFVFSTGQTGSGPTTPLLAFDSVFLSFRTGGTERVRVTSTGSVTMTGSLGLGSAVHGSWSSGFAVLDLFGGKGSFSSDPAGYIQVTQNLYNDGTFWRATSNAAVSMFSLLLNGSFGWYCNPAIAANAQWTPAQRMLLDTNTLTLGVNINTTGNIIFSSAGQRIIADMTTTTLVNRLAFQSSVVNGNTQVSVLPNGTATIAGFEAFTTADPTNSSRFRLIAQSGTAMQIISAASGSGAVLPLQLSAGSAQLQLHISGGISLGDATDPGAGVVRIIGRANFPTNGTGSAGSIYKDVAGGLAIWGVTGSSNDLTLLNGAGAGVLSVPTGTQTSVMGGTVRPGAHNTVDLGINGIAWRDVWCARAAFNGSHSSLKRDWEPIAPEAALTVARETQVGTFRYKSTDPDDLVADWLRVGILADKSHAWLSPDGRNVNGQDTACLALAAAVGVDDRVAQLEARLAAYEAKERE